MAVDINRVTLIGRLVRDAELKYTDNGQAVSKFTIAVNRKKKDGDTWTDEASFFDVTLWGRQAEGLSPYLLKGKQIAVDGELRQDRWQQDGQNRSKVAIIANSVELLGGGSDTRSGTGNGNSYGNGNRNSGGGYSDGG
jgi:single-strand DNA-binding protein